MHGGGAVETMDGKQWVIVAENNEKNMYTMADIIHMTHAIVVMYAMMVMV